MKLLNIFGFKERFTWRIMKRVYTTKTRNRVRESARREVELPWSKSTGLCGWALIPYEQLYVSIGRAMDTLRWAQLDPMQ
jgi:hypothetical protein